MENIGMRLLSLDIGDRRIGVAMSDPSGFLASPLTIIERKTVSEDILAIAVIIKNNDIGQIVIGLPLQSDGGSGTQSEKVMSFAQKLVDSIKVPVDFRDESYTTASARQLMLQTKSKKVRRNTRDDAIAAAFILQHYLDEGHLEYDAGLE